MIARLFHTWERRLAAVTTDRVVRAFEWGIDWLDPPNAALPDADATAPSDILTAWVSAVMENTDDFFSAPPIEPRAYEYADSTLSFPSAFVTPHAANNTVYARYFSAAPQRSGPRRAVIVLPQWNSDADSHIALSQLLARSGISALRLSLPYHDRRMPTELNRADYIVSANVGRTLQVCRQAVLDVRRAVDWLSLRGYDRIGILGTSLGSCLAMLAAAHEPRLSAAALNHISPYFADVVWEGLSTAHVRAGLDGHIGLEQLRHYWLPISPEPYIDRMRGRPVLLVYARYDLSFPVRLSRWLIDEFSRRGVPHRTFALPCGHYTTGVAPFSWIDAYALITFLRGAL